MSKKYTRVDEQEFYTLKQTVKALHESGLSYKKMENILNRGNATLYLTQKYDTYEGYREYIQEKRARRDKVIAKEKVAEPKFVDKKLSLDDNVALLLVAVEEQTSSINELNNTLKVIIEGNKRKWF